MTPWPVELTATTPVHEGTALNFEEFFAAEHDRLYRALCLATRNRHEAEEIMQDAFLALWARWDRISGDVDDGRGRDAACPTRGSRRSPA